MKPSIYAVSTILLACTLISPAMTMENSSISGAVYCDLNNNGQLDEREKGLRNIHVQIFIEKCGGTALQTVHTDEDGNFIFHGFDPNTYYIRADVPCVCGGRLPTTSTCQEVVLREGENIVLPPFGYTEYGQ